MRTRLVIEGKPKPYVMAHRGNRVARPENTLAAFQCAFREDADILETDLHLSADGVFMCIHDATVDRTTDGSGPVSEKSLAELKTLSAACGFPEFASERIPTLSETAALLPPGVALALELKTDEFLKATVATRFVKELTELGIRERTVLLSFSYDRLQSIRLIAQDIPVGWITLSTPFPVHGVQMVGPFWPLLLLNPLYVQRAHRLNQVVCPLDPAPERRLRLYRWLGCDAILTDNPGRTRQALVDMRWSVLPNP